MTQKKPSAEKKQPSAEQTSSIYPLKHPEVSFLLENDGLCFTFHDKDDDDGWDRERDSAVMGRFRCHNPKCTTNGWSSKRIPIVVYRYTGQRYNARVYHQRCRNCDRLSKPILDHTYAERVAYWLKKWSGIRMPTPPPPKKTRIPHERELCEGCKAGHCLGENYESSDLIPPYLYTISVTN
ncbi:zinc-binding domain-containing protein [Xylaria palmicola]|nr:zinc-binding domain-containing protein [Xylaria palmicola]